MSASLQSSPSASNRSRSDLRWLLLFFVSMAAAGVACWHAWPFAITAYKDWRAHRHLSAAREHMFGQKWASAAASLKEARKLSPVDPAVLHASLDFLQQTGRDPRGAVGIVRQLQKTGNATPGDLVILGKSLVSLGEAAEAQKVYDTLLPADRESRPAQELQAYLLEAQGQPAHASELRRQLWQAKPDDPESLRQLATLELTEGPPEARAAMRERLWTLARKEGASRLVAIELLSRDKRITKPQVEELARIAATLPPHASPDGAQETVRLRVLSAQMRVNPQSRSEFIDQEIVRWKGVDPAHTRPLVAWLAGEGEHARILRLVPAALAAKYTDLLPLYVEALRQTGRWQELDSFLASGGIDPVFSKSQKLLWQAEARAKLDADPNRARQMIARLMEEGGRGDDLPLTLQTGKLAERLSFWDLARQCFAACAEKHPSVRTAMLAKVYEVASREHDGGTMLEACTRLAEAQPDNESVQEQKLYLELLLGKGLETASRRAASLAGKASQDRAGQRHLLTAMLAFRQGRPEDVAPALAKISEPNALSAGERAVYAGLFKTSGGNPAAAFRIIEKISPALLLEEEKRFARRAL